MKRFITLIAVAALAGFLLQAGGIGFAKEPKPDYFIDESKLPFDALPDTVTERYWGIHNGAGYRVEVPENWNGDLVLYSHGYRGDGLELTVSNPRIRFDLVKSGYAWAASSYDKNGYDVYSGVKSTHRLTLFFNGLVGKPNRIYLTGHSMGGHITGVTIEQYPDLYDGALPMCGVMADNELFDYFQDYHLAAQYLTNLQVEVPFPDDYSAITIPEMKTALEFLPQSFPYTLSTVGEQFKTTVKYISGGQRPLYDLAFISFANFLFTQIIDAEMVGNLDTFYNLDDDLDEISEDEEAINAEIYRSEPLFKFAKPNGFANVPAISGDLPIPVITLHTLGDLFVPFSMQQIYAQRAAANGKSDLLVQRAIRDVGHCAFTVDEEWSAFADLVNWVENGAKPEGDDLLSPDTVADPDFGCSFTSTDRDFGPYTAPCP